MKKFSFLVLLAIIVGIVFYGSKANATTFSDLKFGPAQLSDTQWDVGACMYTNTCNIYALSGIGVSWNLGYPTTVASTQYISFIASGDANNPWNMKLYNSDGSVAQDLGLGRLAIQGADAAGRHFFFFTNDYWNGTVFSIDYGFPNSNGFSFTGIGSPTVADTNAFAASYGSTSPLGPGETYGGSTGGGSPPAGPTITGGTITQTNSPGTEIITSGSSSTAGPSNTQTTNFTNWNNNPNTDSVNNYLYIDQISGNYNSVNISQSGSKNTMYLGINGSSNNISADQTGTNYLNGLVQGTYNQFISQQSNVVGANYQETKIMSNSYSGNTINATQTGNGNNLMFNTINGSNNSITASQSGNGNHFLENKLTGNGNNILSTQTGSTGNNANIDLTNAGGPASLDIQQSGGKNFTIIQSCTNPAGCTTVIRQ